jgi:hypothetical protein
VDEYHLFITTSVVGGGKRFFTSRAFAVADVDYRGSTGYGRVCRQALGNLWGIADPEDGITVARWLADVRWADPARTVISGASAGGFKHRARTPMAHRSDLAAKRAAYSLHERGTLALCISCYRNR